MEEENMSKIIEHIPKFPRRHLVFLDKKQNNPIPDLRAICPLQTSNIQLQNLMCWSQHRNFYYTKAIKPNVSLLFAMEKKNL